MVWDVHVLWSEPLIRDPFRQPDGAFNSVTVLRLKPRRNHKLHSVPRAVALCLSYLCAFQDP